MRTRARRRKLVGNYSNIARERAKAIELSFIRVFYRIKPPYVEPEITIPSNEVKWAKRAIR